MILRDKSYRFAIDVVTLIQVLQAEKKEFVLTKQLLRSGTSIGALVREAEFAESKADFIHKMSIALKEANETDYWLCILHDSNFITDSQFATLEGDCKQLIAMLVSTVKTAKKS